jgi:starvation-inducible DNA-binding protein
MRIDTVQMPSPPAWQPRAAELTEARAGVIAAMTSVVAETIDASLAARHAHWNVRGPTVHSLHELLGRIHSELEQHVDALAERIGALGGVAHGTAQAVVSESRLPPYTPVMTSADEHVEALHDRLVQLAASMRAALVECERWKDPVSAHHVTEAWAAVDKQGWLLGSHLLRAH